MHKDIIKVVFPSIEVCLKKGNIPFEILGHVCDFQEFGDRCNSSCFKYRHGFCETQIIKDSDGCMWHLFKE